MANTDSTYPLWADQVYAINLSFSDPANASTSVYGVVTPSNLNLTNSSAGTYMNLSSSLLNFSTSNSTLNLSTTAITATNGFALNVSGSLNINASKVVLNGVSAPATPGQALIANDASGGLQWFTITDLLNLEAGVYVNNFNTSATIPFNKPYGVPPAVVITPDAGSVANGRIIPVTLAGVSTTNFNVLFGSNKLTRFNFVVLPINSVYEYNVSSSNFSESSLNAYSGNVSGNLISSSTANASGLGVGI
jgi:hypothetical protein